VTRLREPEQTPGQDPEAAAATLTLPMSIPLYPDSCPCGQAALRCQAVRRRTNWTMSDPGRRGVGLPSSAATSVAARCSATAR
jgi:hypothetical protein